MTVFQKNTIIDSSMPTRMDKYVIYLRKSRADIEAEKLGEGETLARHKKILTELAARKGFYVEKIYEEIVSGETIEARPEIQKMIQECYDGKYKGIIVVDISRLSRGNQGDAQTILDCLKYSNRNNGALVITPTKIYDVAHSQEDEEYMEFELFMSRREYKMIQKRMDRGKKQAVVEGNFMASARPYGYNIVKTKTSRTLIPNPDEAPYVKKIFEWAVKDNMSPYKIAQTLENMGVPTYHGEGEWSKDTIKSILTNPTYIGKVKWNERMQVKTMIDGELITTRPRTSDENDHYMEYDGKHLKHALIDEETFRKVKYKPGSDRTKSNLRLTNALAGIFRCKHCGRMMAYQSYKSRKNYTPPRYLHVESVKCKVKSVLAQDVYKALEHALKLYIEDFEMKLDNLPETDENEIENQIELLEKEITKIKRKLSKLFDSWEDDDITDNEFVERKTIHNERIEKIKQQIEDLEFAIPEREEYQEKTILLSEALRALVDDTLDATIKNEYLKRILDSVEFSRESNSEFILDINLC